MINAPIRQRRFHDAQLWLLLVAFFIAVTLPLAWYTIVLWSCTFCMIGFWSGIGLRYAIKSLAIAFVLSISIWLLNVFFHASDVSPADAMVKANHTGLKIWSLTWVSLLSAKMVNVRDVITCALQRRWLSMQIAYAMLVGIGSIELLRAEARRINLNAKLRGIHGRHWFLQWIPLLIFALRHAQRGAMSLRARGLASHKVFYYDYQPTNRQSIHFACLSIGFVLLALI